MDSRRLMLYVIFIVIFIGLVCGISSILGWQHDGPASGNVSAPGTSMNESKQSSSQENDGQGNNKPAQTENVSETGNMETVDDISGVYRVSVRTNGGGRYSTDVTIKDLGANIQVNANYNGMKIPLTGIQTGSRTKTSGTWSFAARIPLLFDGGGTMTVKSTKSGLVVTAQGSGDYFSFDGGGNGSGNGSGRRVSPLKGTTNNQSNLNSFEKAVSFAAPNKPFPTPGPVNTGAAAAASATGLAAAAGVSARNRIRKNKSSQLSTGNDSQPKSTPKQGGE